MFTSLPLSKFPVAYTPSCTLIAIDGAFKFLDRIHPEFSRTFQIVTTLLKNNIKITHKFLFCTFKARMGLYRGMCGLVPSRVSQVKKRSEPSSLCQKSLLRRCLTTDRSSICMPARTHTHTHTFNPSQPRTVWHTVYTIRILHAIGDGTLWSTTCNRGRFVYDSSLITGDVTGAHKFSSYVNVIYIRFATVCTNSQGGDRPRFQNVPGLNVECHTYVLG